MPAYDLWGDHILRNSIWRLCLPGLFWAFGAHAGTIIDEIEPNDSCETAQNLGTLASAQTVSGEITEHDVDFYRIKGTPGDFIYVSYGDSGSPDVETLYPGHIALLDSNCNILTDSDSNNWVAGEWTLPANGKLWIAMTGKGDKNLDGTHANTGTYLLNIEFGPLSSIYGTIKQPDGSAFAGGGYAYLDDCWDNGDGSYFCTPGATETLATKQSKFVLTPSAYDATYFRVRFVPNGYEFRAASTEVFAVDTSNSQDIKKNITLDALPVGISHLKFCDSEKQSGGSKCKVTFEATNTTATALSLDFWLSIEADNGSGPVSSSVFQTGSAKPVPVALELAPGVATAVTLSFKFPAETPPMAQGRVQLFVSEQDNPYNTYVSIDVGGYAVNQDAQLSTLSLEQLQQLDHQSAVNQIRQLQRSHRQRSGT